MEQPAPVLAIDVGNTRSKFARLAGATCRPLAFVSTSRLGARLPRDINRVLGANDWQGIVVSSVVPSANGELRRALRRSTGHTPLFVSHRTRWPFRLRVATPSQLGADRLCAAAGAVQRGVKSAIIVDVGSAITVDLLAAGSYRGGLIMVGPRLALDALGRFAAKLPPVDQARTGTFPPLFRGTHASMALGASITAIGSIKAAVAALRSRSGRHRAGVYVTGGGAPDLLAGFPASYRHAPNLVFEGLGCAWRLNSR